MLSEERIELMTKLSLFEKREEKRYLRISKYYRSDYIGISLLKNFFAVTIAYILILALFVIYRMDHVMITLNELKLRPLTFKVIAGYLCILAGYSVITYIISSLRYKKAKKSVESYIEDLKKLDRLYKNEAVGTRHKRPGGDRR
ncbi:hypothetical protein INP51_03730 [Blautia liquoris]|jgi:hypothetical protein|uniref:Uncharacterized protein n=1 Tax=Blautia liquoris TaxID=2779518 RepID=A0A7M2RIA9_9FIRM|nr:hypothetical protein [Blautia liquoris]QOV20073.1 hypothetical protein INP51_03730 [Blautia liquoris]